MGTFFKICLLNRSKTKFKNVGHHIQERNYTCSIITFSYDLPYKQNESLQVQSNSQVILPNIERKFRAILAQNLPEIEREEKLPVVYYEPNLLFLHRA
jgi:hypothetical protein